nr:hypothetical protein [Tanacetum cinerariifolium]
MLIPSDLLTNEIRATEYKVCEEKFVRQKRKQTAKDSSLPKPSLKSRVKQIKTSDTPIQQPSDDKEIKEESYASEFVDSVFQDDDDDSKEKIKPGSHKKHLEIVDETEKEKKDDDNDDDFNDDHTDHTLNETQEIGSLETKKEKMQTPIPSTLKSHRTDLSSDKDLSQYLTVNVAHKPATTSQDPSKIKCISSKYTHILRALQRMYRRQDIMIKQIEKKLVT